ncbi:MAG: adenylate/guanylate cyclase domain-containing protein [Anaerolineales bacterium]
MGKPPSGTVTFLFTDIEGSTKLAQEYPGDMPALLARHNEILDQAIVSHDGFLFRTGGDAYCVSFHNSIDALNAALEAQRLLDREAWSPATIKVRMGIHTGAAKFEGESNYSGYATLALVQRIMSVGHGGQVLISQTVHDLLDGNLPEDVQLMDMGERNLKDMLRPEHLYQLAVPDLQKEFPPLNTLRTINHNLSTNLSSFIGRERELSGVKERLEQSRLLTLIGPGGTGKTRLSYQAGSESLSDYKEGVWLIELAPLSDSALIVQTIASVFGLRESPGRPLADLVIDYLRAKQLLLILDNCEHLIDACARLADQLLRHCPNLKVLASSREALGINGEAVYRVPSLSLPEQVEPTRDAVLSCESAQLFVERVSAANPNFKLTDENASSVAQICLRLDGIPLALELAAARVRVLSVEQIAERLDDRFRLLTGGSRTALPRQQTLRALIDWSYDLLSEPEKALFRRLAVFVGGWTLEAAEKVCSGDGVDEYEVLDLLAQLVDKSLVIAEERDGNIRYYRLETIRQYAREKLLETDESVVVRNYHLDFYIDMTIRNDEEYINPRQDDVFKKMISEYDNMRSALSWAVESNLEKAMILLTSASTIWPWILQGKITDANEWCKRILSRLNSLSHEELDEIKDVSKLKAHVLNRYAQVLMNMGNHQASRVAVEESIKLAQEINNQEILAEALATFGHCALYGGDPEAALEAAEKSIDICEREGYTKLLFWAFDAMIHIHTQTDRKPEAAGYHKKAIDLLKKAGVPVDPISTAVGLIEDPFIDNDLDGALKYMNNAIAIVTERNDKYGLTFMQSNFAHALREHGEFEKALIYYRRTIRLWQDWGHRAAIAHQLECFGFIAQTLEDAPRAARLFGAAEAIRTSINSLRMPSEQREFEEAKSKLRVEMEEIEFNKAWDEGCSSTMEQAIEYALGESNE